MIAADEYQAIYNARLRDTPDLANEGMVDVFMHNFRGEAEPLPQLLFDVRECAIAANNTRCNAGGS
jgi:hypothetical protein